MVESHSACLGSAGQSCLSIGRLDRIQAAADASGDSTRDGRRAEPDANRDPCPPALLGSRRVRMTRRRRTGDVVTGGAVICSVPVMG